MPRKLDHLFAPIIPSYSNSTINAQQKVCKTTERVAEHTKKILESLLIYISNL